MPRKQKTIHYLYKTTCLITGKYYIGMHSTANLEDGYMGSGKRLRYSLRKHGKENHVKEILEFFESRELLIEAEKQSITADMVVDRMCMNMMSGGTGGFVSEVIQLKRSIAGNKKHNENLKSDEIYRKNYSDKVSNGVKMAHQEGRLKGRDGGPLKGRKLSYEHKKKIGERSKIKQSGKLNSQYGTCWVTNEIENKKIKRDELQMWVDIGWKCGKFMNVPKELINEMKNFYNDGNSYEKVAIKFKMSKTTVRKYLK